MELHRKSFVLLLALFNFDYAIGNTITVPPTGGVFPVGSTIVLSCGVDTLTGDVLRWSEFITNHFGNPICTVTSDKGIQCSSNKNARYTVVSNSTGMYNLIITNAQLADGGAYQCGFSQVSSNSPVATVTIFDKIAISLPPQPSLNQPIPITCNVTFQTTPFYELPTGAAQPVATLKASSSQAVSGGAQQIGSSNGGLYSVSANLTTTIQSYNQLPMNATCTFSVSNPQSSYTNSSQINIIYPVRNANIYPLPAPNNGMYQFSVGDNITCSADGNPPPAITWNDVASGGNVPSLPPQQTGYSEITFEDDWVGPTHTLTCTAINSIPGSQSQTATFNITFTVGHAANNPNVSSAGLGWIAAVVIVPIAVIVAIVVIVLVLRRKRNQAPSKAAPPPVRPTNMPQQQSAYVPVSQNPNYAMPPGEPGQLTPNGRHAMTRDSPGFGDLGVNRFGLPQGHPNLSASFDDNTSLNGKAPMPPTSRPPELPNDSGRMNRSPMFNNVQQQQPQRYDPDTMV